VESHLRKLTPWLNGIGPDHGGLFRAITVVTELALEVGVGKVTAELIHLSVAKQTKPIRNGTSGARANRPHRGRTGRFNHPKR